jgi:predicted MPP superfamily phosphohydrolase
LQRDIRRIQIFERFLLFFGLASGVAAALLVAWLIAVRSGLDAIPGAALVWGGLAMGVVGAWGMPRLTRAARNDSTARIIERPLFALGFVLIALAGTIVAASVAFAAVSALLAVTGISPDAGLALFRAGTLAAAFGVGATLVWGFNIEGRLVEVTQTRVEIAGLAPALHGLRIAHLSDLHIGNGLEGRRLEALVARINGLGADAIVITGDLFDNDAQVLLDGAAVLGGIQAPLGVYAVLGNHDLYIGLERVAGALAAHAPAVTLLRGRWAVLPAAAPLLLAGVDDPGHDWSSDPEARAELEKLAAARPLEGPALLLAHRPDAFPLVASLGFALMLSGHYHGGQVALPLAGGRFNTARLLTPFDRGLHRVGNAALYVSRGLGFAGPRLRIASRPEIAVLELV